ncbi:hypothetical protein JBE27_48300, partial [Streptomyces albiflaviniger]|nr:hypothetical protein [Streptomyces albiflaviniger]
MSLSVHEFFHALLYVYGVQLHHFTPNALLHISCYIVLCECFLGVHPHWGLWKRIFFVKRQSGSGIGSFVVGVRPDVGYLSIPLLESVQGWRKKWFYVRDETNAAQPHGLPPFEARAEVRKKRSCGHDLSATEAREADQLLIKVKALQETTGMEVLGTHLISAFIRRRVQPLQARIHTMWEYEGSQDPTRIQKGDLSNEELEKRVRGITNLKTTD